MNDSFFLNLYFANHEGLAGCETNRKFDLLSLPILDGLPFHNFKDFITVSAQDILKMGCDAWAADKHKTSLQNSRKINPQNICNDFITCMDMLEIDWEHYEVDYHKYYSFECVYDIDEEWYDDDEMLKFQTKGYRKIDLDLINATVKRDRLKMIDLLRAGASPDIDPNGEEFAAVHLLSCDASINFHFYSDIWVEHYRKQYPYTPFEMIQRLYGTASAEKLLETIYSSKNSHVD